MADARAGLKTAALRGRSPIGLCSFSPTATEGESTRWASWALLIVLAAEVLLIVFDVSFDLAQFLGASSRTMAGYDVPIGDVKVVGPAIMAVLSLILIVRTRGRYTRWLAAVILVTCFAIIYTVDPGCNWG